MYRMSSVRKFDLGLPYVNDFFYTAFFIWFFSLGSLVLVDR